MDNITLDQKMEPAQFGESCDIMAHGAAGSTGNVKKAETIISQYWMKYNEKDGYWYAKVPNPKRGG